MTDIKNSFWLEKKNFWLLFFLGKANRKCSLDAGVSHCKTELVHSFYHTMYGRAAGSWWLIPHGKCRFSPTGTTSFVHDVACGSHIFSTLLEVPLSTTAARARAPLEEGCLSSASCMVPYVDISLASERDSLRLGCCRGATLPKERNL